MALKGRITFSKVLVWRFGLPVFGALILLFAGLLWMSGAYETHAAFKDGRRLLVNVDDGSITGKQVTIEEPKAEPSPAAQTPPAETAEAPPSSSGSTTLPQPAPAKPAETAEAPPSSSGSTTLPQPVTPGPNDTAATLATVPLAGLNPSLMEKADAGSLPAIGRDGTKPWKYYAKPFERKGSLPVIAVIVSGLGESKVATENAMKLPENMTLSFNPYAKDIDSWVTSGRVTGHEVMIDLPLEPSNYPTTDPGPYGLLPDKPADQNEKRLEWLMARTAGYIGFLTPQNEAFSSNNDAFKLLLQALANHGLMIAMGHEPAKTDTKQMIESGNTPAVVGDVLIDEELSPTAIQARLITLEQMAKTRGYAIGVAQAYPITMEQLNLWAAKLSQDGFVLVPVSYIAKLRFS